MKYDGQIAMCIAFHTEARRILNFDFWAEKEELEDKDDVLSEMRPVKCSDEEAESWGVYATIQDEGLLQLPLWVASLDSREAAKQFCDLQNDLKRDIAQSSLMKAFMTVNWEILKQQKEHLLEVIDLLRVSDDSTDDQWAAMNGLLAMIDGIQDAAIEDGLTTEEETLLMEPEGVEGFKKLCADIATGLPDPTNEGATHIVHQQDGPDIVFTATMQDGKLVWA